MSRTTPTYFMDDLQQRTFPHRFRQIGNPFEFLNGVGIVPMLEYIYKGNTVIDLAHEMDVSVTNLRRWIEEENHSKAVEEAEQISAEGYLAKAAKDLREAKTEFELKKAKEALNHARFMASKKDRPTYGGDTAAVQVGSGAGVTFVLNMAGPGAAPTKTLTATAVPQPKEQTIIDIPQSEQQLVPPRAHAPIQGLEDILGATPEYLKHG